MNLSLPILAILALVAGAALAAESVAVENRKSHNIPNVGKYQVLAGDFHIHTTYSDGKKDAKERVMEAYRAGYDVISITDHGKIEGYADAIDTANKLGMILIRGVETGIGGKEHFVVLGVPSDYKPIDAHKWAESKGQETAFYQDELLKIEKLGCFVIYAHPHVGNREPMYWAVERDIIEGVEVRNDVVREGWNTTLFDGVWCYPNGLDLALEKNLTIFANTDLHGLRTEAAELITFVLAKDRTPKSVLEALRARRTFACFDGMIWGHEEILKEVIKSTVTITRDADDVRVANRSPISLKADIQGTKVEIPKNEEVRISNLNPGSLTITWDNIRISTKAHLVTVVPVP